MRRGPSATARLTAVLLLVLVAAHPAPALAVATERLHVNALVLDFDPIMDSGLPLTVDRSWGDPLLLDEQYRSDVSAASGGVVRQRVVRTAIIRAFPPKPGGFVFTTGQYMGCLVDSAPTYCGALIDYGVVLNTSYDRDLGSACQALAAGRVDEIWLWGGPWFGYSEFRIVPGGTLCPAVTRPFAVMGFSYERTVAEMLHDLGHRAEATIQAGIGLALWDRFDGQRARYAEDFACPSQPDATHPEVDATQAHAGNVHFPPNAYCHYQYDRDHPVLSDADDWANFPNLTGQQTVVNASTWGGTQRGYMIWWLGRFPRKPGASDGALLDWWRYLYPSARGRPS